jgi:hypothetical protein
VTSKRLSHIEQIEHRRLSVLEAKRGFNDATEFVLEGALAGAHGHAWVAASLDHYAETARDLAALWRRRVGSPVTIVNRSDLLQFSSHTWTLHSVSAIGATVECMATGGRRFVGLLEMLPRPDVLAKLPRFQRSKGPL